LIYRIPHLSHIGEGYLPPTVKVVHGPMPHHKLFPRLAAVHHGGAGNTATVLRSVAPQVLVPHMMDQLYYADRLATLGLAPAGIPADRITPTLEAREARVIR